MTAKTYFEELSYALRRRELLPRSLEEDGLLRVRLLGHCAGCPSATITTEQIIQEAVCAAIPEVRQVVLVEEIDEDLLAQARAILRRRASPDGGK